MPTPSTWGRSLPPVVAALLAAWRVRVGLALAPLAGLALWSNALTDHVGYGAALVTAVLASVLGALGGAGLPGALRRRGAVVPGAHAALGAALYPAVLVLVTTLTVLAHGLFAPACGPGGGALYVLLVALPGAVLAGLAGLCLGALTTRRYVGTALAALLVPAFVAWSVVRFYRSPAIFAYDPFFGFYPGAIYDESVPLGLPLVTYRLGTLGWIAALAALVVLAWTERATLAWRRAAGALAVGAAGLLVGAGVYLAGAALRHRSDADDVARALQGQAWSRRCVVRYDATIDARQARLTARDCDVRVAQLEAFYGVRQRARITVYLFATSAQKQALMGAADTYIAKPWRNEVYLQYAPFPHPVLKHELAHVVAGNMAPGPLHVTARAALVPVPGLIEGAAVAAAWEGESDATPHQWSRAMLDAGMAPRVRALTGLGFFGAASVKAYTAAGSFCRWLVATHGRARFQRVYATGDFDAAYGRSLADLERDWHAFLRAVPTPERVLVRARTRFRRASVFAKTCPLELEDLERGARRHLHAGELAEAARRFDELMRYDPTDVAARQQRAEVAVREGDVDHALALARATARVLGPSAEARMRVRVADLLWRWRDGAGTGALYASVDPELFDEDEARTLVLKRELFAAGGPWREALRDLLIGRGEVDPDATSAAMRLAAEHARSGDARAAYFLARLYFLHERFPDALAALPPAAVAGLADPRVAAEARRIVATARYHQGDRAGAAAAFRALADDPARPEGARDAARDWLDRLARER